MIPLPYFFGSAGILTLSGETVSDSVADPANALATITIKADGTVEKTEGAGNTTQVDSATDWIIPNAFAPGDYEARFTSVTGDTPTSSSGAEEDEWFALSGGDFPVTLLQESVGSKLCSFTLEIRKGSSGAAIASGSYNLSVAVT